MSRKISHKTFVMRAIRALHNPRFKHKGIHVVYSGFNNAFREYYDNEDPRPVIDVLVEEKVIEKRVVKGGCLIFLTGEAPDQQPTPTPTDTIGKILGHDGPTTKRTRKKPRGK